jgi:hypothetical protein
MIIDSNSLAGQQRELNRRLREAVPGQIAFTPREVDILFEIEATLHCLEILSPDSDDKARNPADAWGLLSGYVIPGGQR